MVTNLKLLHYLSEATYTHICNKLGLNPNFNIIGDNFVQYPGHAINKVHMFNINYNTLGRTWFMRVDVEAPLLGCSNDEFPDVLYAACADLFGEQAMADFPEYSQINCDYVEYSAVVDAGPADEAILKLLSGKCVPDQLDRNRWANYEKPHSTIALYICKEDESHLRLLAKCHGTAMKKRLKEASLHRATGIMPAVAMSKQTEREILEFQIAKFFAPVGLNTISNLE